MSGWLKRSVTYWTKPTPLQWGLIALFTVLFIIASGLRAQIPLMNYDATIGPAVGNHSAFTMIIYGRRADTYIATKTLLLPSSGWSVLKQRKHSIKLQVASNAPPLSIHFKAFPNDNMVLTFQQAKAMIALTDLSNHQIKRISLHGPQEAIPRITIGTSISDVLISSQEIYKVRPWVWGGGYLLILISMILIAQLQLYFNKQISKPMTSSWSLLLGFALILFLSTLVMLLAFWPGAIAHDAAMQWSEAVGRGHLSPQLVISATLFFRLFTYLSHSPAWPILFTSLLAALGVAFVLIELCYRGVSRWVALCIALLLAMTPQYPTFFIALSKDALSAVGILFLAGTFFYITRKLADQTHRMNYVMLMLAVFAAVFASIMRFNMFPAICLVMLVFSGFLWTKKYRWTAVGALIAFMLLAMILPQLMFDASYEGKQLREATKMNPTTVAHTSNAAPFIRMNAYHLFAAAVHSGIPLQDKDTALFYQIAPSKAWSVYDCSMTDATTTSVSQHMLLSPAAYDIFLEQHLNDLAAADFRIVKAHPSILVNRQLCMTRLLWYIGYGEVPFEATATLGYDLSAGDPFAITFPQMVGPNHTLLPSSIQKLVRHPFVISQSHGYFWLFWKPALPLYLGLFCMLFYLTLRKDWGVVLVLTIPIALTLVLAAVIPFPAYRYQYPAALLCMLLSSLIFAKKPMRLASRQ